MKAIIVAAGQGSRLRPHTNDRPKCLVPYQGQPIIEHILSALRINDIDDIILATGYKKEVLEREIAKRDRLRTCFNPRFAETNMVHSLFCAESEMDDDLIISYGDIVYRPEIITLLLAEEADFSVVVDRKWRQLWEARMADPLADAETLKLDADGNIVELGRKPKNYDEIEGQYIGLIKISRTALPRVRTFYHTLDKERLYDGQPFEKMYMTSFIQQVIDHLMPVRAVSIEGGWTEIDCPADLDYELDLTGKKEPRND